MTKDKDYINITLSFPGGDISKKDLKQIADVMKRYNLSLAKITGGRGISLANVPKLDAAVIKNELGLHNTESSSDIRSIQACSGVLGCRKGENDTQSLVEKLKNKAGNMQLPGKVKVAVSGCENCCMQSMVRDLGFIAKPKGWTVTAGGITGGAKPRVADVMAENLTDEEAINMALEILKTYARLAKGRERIAKIIDRIGLLNFKKELE